MYTSRQYEVDNSNAILPCTLMLQCNAMSMLPTLMLSRTAISMQGVNATMHSVNINVDNINVDSINVDSINVDNINAGAPHTVSMLQHHTSTLTQPASIYYYTELCDRRGKSRGFMTNLRYAASCACPGRLQHPPTPFPTHRSVSSSTTTNVD